MNDLKDRAIHKVQQRCKEQMLIEDVKRDLDKMIDQPVASYL
jgi:hypothetical protein